MIHKLPPHSPLKVRQLAHWACEFEHKPRQVLTNIAFNPDWEVTNLNERAVALEAIIHFGITRQDVLNLFDFLNDDEHFPILIDHFEICEEDIPEGLDILKYRDPLEYTRREFLRNIAHLKQRSAQAIAEYILRNKDLEERLPELTRICLTNLDNMLGEEYFMPIDEHLSPNNLFIDFLRVLYIVNKGSARPIMEAYEIDESKLGLSIDQRMLISQRMPEYTI